MHNIRQKITDILNSDYNTKEKIKINGEVFTPFSLIEEMLDKLPPDSWTDPNKTWLDPAAGLGNFSAVIVERLMDGLSDKIKDKEKRYKHIVEKQLYFIELNPTSCKHIQNIFNSDNKYKLNLVCADALNPKHEGWRQVGYMWKGKSISEKYFEI